MAVTDVKQLLLDTITNTFQLPIYLQGSLSVDDAYPASFFTFWNNYTDDSSFYDNIEHNVIWDFDLNFYSTDPVLVNTILLQAKAALKAVGFIPDGSGHDVASDEPTHTGRGLTILYTQKVG